MSDSPPLERIHVDGYDAIVGRSARLHAGSIVRSVAPAHRFAIISDENVAPLYAGELRATFGNEDTRLFTIPAGESHKTREQWASLTDALLAEGFGRDTTILALGGGVIGDLAGFVAATYMRGVPFVQIPTTLLAMIDASIGGKTGVDTAAGKNLVGAFHKPRAVIVDPDVLVTLPMEQLRSGSAEAVKHGVIARADYYEMVDRAMPSLFDDPAGSVMLEVIIESIKIKASLVRGDERESDVRKILNFGHTIGHAIESESGYRLLHGEAIAIGMVSEAMLGEKLGITEVGLAHRLQNTLLRAGLPVAIPKDLNIRHILSATRIDKKAREGVTEYALIGEIGRWTTGVRAPDATVLEVLTQNTEAQ